MKWRGIYIYIIISSSVYVYVYMRGCDIHVVRLKLKSRFARGKKFPGWERGTLVDTASCNWEVEKEKEDLCPFRWYNATIPTKHDGTYPINLLYILSVKSFQQWGYFLPETWQDLHSLGIFEVFKYCNIYFGKEL